MIECLRPPVYQLESTNREWIVPPTQAFNWVYLRQFDQGVIDVDDR